MTDDDEPRELELDHRKINLARGDIATKEAALNVLSHAAELERIGDRAVVWDDQLGILDDAVAGLVSASDAIWPGDEGMPGIDEFLEESDAVVLDDE